MSISKNPARVRERHEAMQRECLEANGWTFVMWRWFWVWRKKVEDGDFICMTTAEALTVEGALQSSADCFPKKPAAARQGGGQAS